MQVRIQGLRGYVPQFIAERENVLVCEKAHDYLSGIGLRVLVTFVGLRAF
jgi:hypothetical protein